MRYIEEGCGLWKEGNVHRLTTGSVPCTKSGKNNQILQAQNQGKPKNPAM